MSGWEDGSEPTLFTHGDGGVGVSGLLPRPRVDRECRLRGWTPRLGVETSALIVSPNVWPNVFNRTGSISRKSIPRQEASKEAVKGQGGKGNYFARACHNLEVPGGFAIFVAFV